MAVGVAVLALLWAGLVVIALYAPSDLARNVYLSMFGASIVIGVPVVGWLNTATRGTTSLSEHYLDERQIAERRKAYATAHKVTTVMFAVLFLLALNWVSDDGQFVVTVPLALIGPLALTVLVTHAVMPLLIAGWRLTDPPPDDEE